MLKDEPEPEDLTHLAPTAGDVCIPLGSGHIFSDVLDTLMLSADNYCPLLSEASKEISPVDSPFLIYRDDLSNSGSLSPPLTHVRNFNFYPYCYKFNLIRLIFFKYIF